MKKLLLMLAAFLATIGIAFAAVDANTATQAELDAIPGIGPAIAARIVEERKKGAFKDVNDLQERVKGIGEQNVQKMVAGGLTVGGKGRAAAPEAAKQAPKAEKAKPEAKKDEPRVEKAAKADAKKDEPKAAKAKADEKPAAKAEKAPKADKAKDEKKADSSADTKKDAKKEDVKK